MQGYAKCMFIIFYCLFTITKKAQKKQKTKENKKEKENGNNKTTINTKCASKLLRVRFAYVFYVIPSL